MAKTKYSFEKRQKELAKKKKKEDKMQQKLNRQKNSSEENIEHIQEPESPPDPHQF